MRKNIAIETVEKMPENFQVDELIEKLIFIEQVEAGMADIKNKNLIDHEEVIRQSSLWSKK
jgi:hypothetical protein